MLSKRLAAVDTTRCVACGVCENTCPLGAVKVRRGYYAAVESERCVGCGKCARLCICAILYFTLGFFNILFAWLGMIDFLLPLILAIFGGNKFFCNHLCGRGQLFSKLGTDLKCSRCRPTPRWMSSKWFRYGFLIFFLTMFGNMVFQTYLVAAGAASMREAIKLFWTFRVPWDWAYTAGTVTDWVAQFSFGFYSLMLTSLLIGLIVMVLYKPRTWCAFCPMGTMTQSICKLKNKD